MDIKYHKNFVKNYKKRFGGSKKFDKQYKNRLNLFMKNPSNPILKDHQLRGKKITLRAFSVTGNIRVVYTLRNDTAYFLDIGTHNQVY